MNRMARLEHDPMAGTPTVPLTSTVPKPPAYYPDAPKQKPITSFASLTPAQRNKGKKGKASPRAVAPLTAAEILGIVPLRAAKPTRVVDHMPKDSAAKAKKPIVRRKGWPPESVMREQGRRLVRARQALGWSQALAADLIGIGASTMSAHEVGRSPISPKLRDRIATVMNLPVDWHVVTP